MKRPTLILLVGVPGSGKTTYAKTITGPHDNTIHLSSDQIRKELWGSEEIQGDNNEVFSLMQSKAIEALNDGLSVVYDATNVTRKDRSYIISLCPKFIKIEAHVVWAPIETCIRRDAARSRTVGKAVIDKMLKRFQAPYYDEGIDEIKVILPDKFNQQDYRDEVLDDMKIPHDNPHHALNIYDHCFEAGAHISRYIYNNKNYMHKCLVDPAIYHDIGKPYTKSFKDSKGNPCDTAHYYQHQCVGSWMSYGLPEALHDDRATRAWLISTHMDPYLNTKYYNRLPKYLKELVDKLHEADKAAH